MAYSGASFDPFDRSSWYFENISRLQANCILEDEEDGVFLVRNSSSIADDYVLSVKESQREQKFSHYLISYVQTEDGYRYKFGTEFFSDLPSLLNFYKMHKLETVALLRPAPRQLPKYVAKFDFPGQFPDRDLPFRKGDVLWIVQKEEGNEWWMARNSLNQEGQIPCNYVLPLDSYKSSHESSSRVAVSSPSLSRATAVAPSLSNGSSSSSSGVSAVSKQVSQSCLNRKLPAYVRVISSRDPNYYDKAALKLQVGDIIKVIKTSASGTFEGELNGKHGHFPFHKVEWIDDDDNTLAAAAVAECSNGGAAANDSIVEEEDVTDAAAATTKDSLNNNHSSSFNSSSDSEHHFPHTLNGYGHGDANNGHQQPHVRSTAGDENGLAVKKKSIVNRLKNDFKNNFKVSN